MQSSPTVKKDFYLPLELATKLTNYAKQRGTTFSEFVRIAIQEKLDYLERMKIEEEVREACENYREFNKQFSPEWAQFETRIK